MSLSPARLALAAAVSIAALGGASALAAGSAGKSYTDWQVTRTFKADGATTCAVRTGVERGGYTLSLEGKLPNGARSPVPTVTFGNLPPLLAGKKGTIRDVKLTIGDWTVSGLKADWTHGSGAANSRIALSLATKAWPTVIAALSQAQAASASVTLINGTHEFPVRIAPAKAAVAAFADCLR
jgi:hypothetical protein